MRVDDRGRDGLHHVSGYVCCPRRGAVAMINATERRIGPATTRSIVWCSLRGAAQWCAEDCGAPIAALGEDAAAALG